MLCQHFGRFGTPEVIPTFHNDLIKDLCCMTGVEQSLTTAYSKEENAIAERATL